MRRVTMIAVIAVLMLGLGACGSREKEELRQKVASLEQQLLAVTKEKDAATASLADAQKEVAACKIEREKLKTELNAAKKKTATTTKKKK